MRRFFFFVVAAALGACVFVLLAPARFGGLSRTPETFTPATAPRLEVKDLPSLNSLDAEYTKLVESVVPSVVSVASTRKVRVPMVDSWDYLFGWRGRVTERPESSLGSGVIVSKEGHILTNHHVVAGMQEIQVQLTDGRTLPATIIGSDQSVDIAVLHVNLPNAQPLLLADSDKVRVGQLVFAVGNPFGLQETVTRGIVSAKGRALRDSGVEFFQTDAAVNPGNSGGPLLNIRGEIIGINSAIYSQTGGWAGISFAIPANVARRTLESILKTGRPERGYLGVNWMPLNPSLAQQFGLRDTKGALVTEVAPGSPADRAGIAPGDVIRSFNRRPVPDATTLRDRIAQAQVGSKVELGIARDGQEQTVTTEIVEAPAEARTGASGPRPAVPEPATPRRPKTRANVLSGVAVGAIPAAIADGLPPNVQGVIVTQVEPDSPAGEKLRVGDVIEEVNKRPIATPQDFEAAAAAIQPTERALVFVCRGRARAFVVVAP